MGEVKGNNARNSQLGMEIKFINPKTEQPEELAQVALAFFDLDTASRNRNAEYLMATGWESYGVAEDTELNITKAGNGYTKWSATRRGNGWDNPRDPSLLTGKQRARTVQMTFKNVSKIRLHVGTTRGRYERHFLFATQPALECGKVKWRQKVDLRADHGLKRRALDALQ